jgi:SNF2 family DNA or RNA helicase
VKINRLEDCIWVDAQPPDSSIADVMRRTPTASFIMSMRMWSVNAKYLKRLVLDLYSNSVVRSAHWPFQGNLGDECSRIVEEHKQALELLATEVDRLEVPDYLVYNGLRPRNYQYQLIRWLNLARKGIVALAPGLGKTMSVINATKEVGNTYPSPKVLVVCRANEKVSVWKEEVLKFSDLTPMVIAGTKEERIKQYREDADIYIANPELVIRDWSEVYSLVSKSAILVADEANFLSHLGSKINKLFSILAEMAEFVWLLTGTPMENNLMELFDLVEIVCPGLLGKRAVFQYAYHYTSDSCDSAKRAINLAELRKKVFPVMFRRTKKEVEDELPERVVKRIDIFLSRLQKDLYNKARKNILTEVDNALGSGSKLQMHNALVKTVRLKQICDDPALLGHESTSPKADFLYDLAAGELSGEKIIVFTQFKEMAKLLHNSYGQFGAVLYTGDQTQLERQEAIKKFQTDPDCGMIIGTTAMTRGINLTAAGVVVLFDLPYNPMTIEQVISRGHRLGNLHENLLVYYLLCHMTIDEETMEMGKDKTLLSSAVIDGDEQALEEYNERTLEYLLNKLKVSLQREV